MGHPYDVRFDVITNFCYENATFVHFYSRKCVGGEKKTNGNFLLNNMLITILSKNFWQLN